MKKLRITIGNKSYEVTVEDLTELEPYQAPASPPPSNVSPAAATPPTASAADPQPQLPVDAGAVNCPMAGAIKSVLVKQGDSVRQGQTLVVLEAMKMENNITAPVAGTVKSVHVAVGESVADGQVLVVLE